MPLGTIKSVNEITGVVLIAPDEGEKDLFWQPCGHSLPPGFAAGLRVVYDHPRFSGGHLARNVRLRVCHTLRMDGFYYLRLCQKSWHPLEEYIDKGGGIIRSRDKPSMLMRFASRNEAAAFVERHAHLFPDRVIQILLHITGRAYSEHRE